MREGYLFAVTTGLPALYSGWDRLAAFGLAVAVFFLVVWIIPWVSREDDNEEDN